MLAIHVVATGMKIGPAGSSNLLDDSNRKREVRLMKNRWAYLVGTVNSSSTCITFLTFEKSNTNLKCLVLNLEKLEKGT